MNKGEPQTYVDLQDCGNAQATLIMHAIARHADWDTGECFPSQKTLARMSKCCERTLRSYLARLERDGFIERQERRAAMGGRLSDRIVIIGYAEWISALRIGGVVKRPRSVGRYETLPAMVAANPPAKFAARPGKLPAGGRGNQAAATREPSLNVHTTKRARGRTPSEVCELELEGKGIRERLRSAVRKNVYDEWFADMTFVLDQVSVRAASPHAFKAKWVRERFADDILAACRAEWPSVRSVEIVHREETSSEAA